MEEVILRATVTSEKGLAGRALRVFVVGKWRLVATCGWHGLPSRKSVAKAIYTIRFNTGSYDSYYTDPKGMTGYSTHFNPEKGTFGGKEIILAFEHIANAYKEEVTP